MWQALYNFPSFSCILLLRISCLFYFNRKMKQKRETLWWCSIFTFFSSIDLFEDKDLKRNLTDGKLKMCFKEDLMRFSWLEELCYGMGFWVVNTRRAPVQKRVKRSTINFAHTFLADCCTKPCRIFSNNEFSFFIAVIRRVLKTYFAWKQLKVDYSKNI